MLGASLFPRKDAGMDQSQPSPVLAASAASSPWFVHRQRMGEPAPSAMSARSAVSCTGLVAGAAEDPVVKSHDRPLTRPLRCDHRKEGRTKQAPITVDHDNLFFRPSCGNAKADRRRLSIIAQHVEVTRQVTGHIELL